MTIDQRRELYRELIAKVPGGVSARMRWLREHFDVSAQTARTWNMQSTKRPMPKCKLDLMKQFLAQEGKSM